MSIPHLCGPISLSVEESSSLFSACWALCPSLWCLLNLHLLLLLVLLRPPAWVLLGPAQTGRRRHPSFCCQAEDVWDCSPKVPCSPVPVVGWCRFGGCWRGRFGSFFHGSASGVSGVLQERRRLVPKAGGRRLGLPSVLCRGYSSWVNQFCVFLQNSTAEWTFISIFTT